MWSKIKSITDVTLFHIMDAGHQKREEFRRE